MTDYSLVTCRGLRALPNCPTGSRIRVPAVSKSQQRRMTAEAGWAVDGDAYLCPRCAAEGHRLAVAA